MLPSTILVYLILNHFRLRASGLPYKFCSNESICTREKFADKLNIHGLNISEQEIVCPAPILADILRKENLNPHLLVHPGIYLCLPGYFVTSLS